MKRIANIGILIILLWQTLSAWGQNQDSQMIRARYLLTINDLDSAKELMDKLSPTSVDQSLYNFTYGMVLLGLGDLNRAEPYLLRVNGDLAVKAYYQLARSYAKLNNAEKSTEYLARHLASKNHYREVFVKTDQAFALIDESRPWIRLWQQEWYSDIENLIREGEYQLSGNHWEAANEVVGKILALEPASPDADFLHARIELSLEKHREANRNLDQAIQNAGNRLDLLEEILTFCLNQEDYKRVIVLADQLLKLDPTNPDYLFTRALGRIADGNESLVAREMQEISDIGIAPSELYYQAAIRTASSTPERAEQYLNQAISQCQKLDDRYYYLRGLVRKSMNQFELALEDMAMSLDINPKQPDLYFERGDIRLLLGDKQGACYDWRRALSLGHKQAPDRLYKHCK